MRARTREGQRGQALPIVALGMVAFIAFLGLALDGGASYLQQRSLQRAADLAALAAASSYYRANLASGYIPAAPASAMINAVQDARNTAISVVTQDGYATTAITFDQVLDYQGNALALQCSAGPTPPASGCPAASVVRGFSVTLSRTAPTTVMRAVGITSTTIGATASAMITVPGGAVRIAPLLLQNYTDGTHSLPRNTPYPTCAQAPGDGIQDAPSPDCRPRVGEPLVLVQSAELFPPGLDATFAAAPRTDYFILHDPPTCNTGGSYPSFSTCDATAGSTTTPGTVATGETSTITSCPPSSVATPCATTQYYAELNHNFILLMQNDNVATGMNARIDKAAASWAGQDCSNPHGGAGVPPLAPDNPRLMRLPVNYAAPLSGANNVGAAQVSETVMFCVQYNAGGNITSHLPQSGNDYAVTGYFVNVADDAGTTTATPGQYFGQDVLIRLLS